MGHFHFLPGFVWTGSLYGRTKNKEIGIRKVLGASILSLWTLLSKDFIKLVLLSCLIATPLAYWFMDSWLQKYSYHIEMGWWIFILASFSAVFITLVTVSYQAISAAMANPVKSLRTE
ncbi:ABC transporter permease [Pseudarcicella hirudinis]|uniref:ABC transporter permease n=1 Tax=Pseudarcicella hirudinis TaxID=1079859 RepID=UPI0035EF6D4C